LLLLLFCFCFFHSFFVSLCFLLFFFFLMKDIHLRSFTWPSLLAASLPSNWKKHKIKWNEISKYIHKQKVKTHCNSHSFLSQLNYAWQYMLWLCIFLKFLKLWEICTDFWTKWLNFQCTGVNDWCRYNAPPCSNLTVLLLTNLNVSIWTFSNLKCCIPLAVDLSGFPPCQTERKIYEMK